MSMPDPIKIELCDEEAERLAESVYDEDPVKDIAPSLLSATDIVEYAEKTAFINPFTATTDTLKHASYEGKLGNARAFIYRENGRHSLNFSCDGYLKVEANSIVFVETEFFFRLPRYIAARFNLQIKHVHRGLLLGTGPLIDPGFRGRLLIPLHNLTSEDYFIHKEEGLIWLEFTRTTYNSKRPEPYGDYPDRKRISDGAKWLDKAAVCEHQGRSVPIRSSIPAMVAGLTKSSEKASQSAAAASKEVAEASKTVNSVTKRYQRISYWGAVAASLGIIALWATFYLGMNSSISSLSARVDGIVGPSAMLGEQLELKLGKIEAQERTIKELELRVSTVNSLLQQNLSNNDDLKMKVSDHESLIKALQQDRDRLADLLAKLRENRSQSSGSPAIAE